MVRRSLFWGLTLMLCAVLAWLIINGRREEIRQTAAKSEVVQTAQLSPTRVLGAVDLEVSEPGPEGTRRGERQELLGPVTIHNRGALPYHNTALRLQCLDAGGKVVDNRVLMVPETILPGQSITIRDLVPDKLPRSAARCRLTVAYSDLGAAPQETEEPKKAAGPRGKAGSKH